MKTSPININTSFPLDNAVEIQKQNQKLKILKK